MTKAAMATTSEPYPSMIVVVAPFTAKLAPAFLQPATPKGAAINASVVAASGAVGWTAMRAAGRFLRQLRRLQRDGLYITPVSSQWAAEFDFPLGSPERNIVYSQHPVIPTVYLPMARFHQFAFQHKVREASRLLAALGAEHFVIRHEWGWKRSFAADIGLDASASNRASGKLQAHKKGEILFSAKLPGNHRPSVPDDLFWFDREPLWRDIADMRLHYGLEHFDLYVDYNEDFGINAELEGALKRIGRLKIGGSFSGFQETRWHMTGVFTQFSGTTPKRVGGEQIAIGAAAFTKQELADEARELAIPGRSGMSKQELFDAIANYR